LALPDLEENPVLGLEGEPTLGGRLKNNIISE
jgi:hypothetical protein